MLPTDTADRLRELAADWMRRWGVERPDVEVAFNPRLRTSAGRALLRQGRIELNPHVLARAPEAAPRITIHEAAHLAVHRLHGPRAAPHGAAWAELMRQAGLPPDVTHKLPVAGLRRRRYLYLRLCGRCDARRLLRAVRYDRCHRCGRRNDFLVMRAAATAAGRDALLALSPAEVRSQCASGRG